MGINLRTFIRWTWLLLPVIALILAISIAAGQTIFASESQQAVATMPKAPGNKVAGNAPVFTDYRGVTIGMTIDEVRSKLDRIKKGDYQDHLQFSEGESAQIYYNDQGKVMAVSVDYVGDQSNAPTAESVLGVSVEPKPNGSMYKLNRYPEAGYWVSYNRTAGDKPIITITMQKM